MALQGDPLHTRRLAELAALPAAADDESRLAQYPEASCRNLEDEWMDDRAARRWNDSAGLQPAELSAQLRANYLEDAYRRRDREVRGGVALGLAGSACGLLAPRQYVRLVRCFLYSPHKRRRASERPCMRAGDLGRRVRAVGSRRIAVFC